MKLSFLTKSISATIISLFSFYAPIYATVLVVLLIISTRFVLDLIIVRKSNKSTGTKCVMYKDAGENFFKFLIAYLIILLLVYPTDINILAFFGSKNFIVTRLAALFIIIYEFMIINLRVKALTGESLASRIMKVVKIIQKAKDIKDNIQEK